MKKESIYLFITFLCFFMLVGTGRLNVDSLFSYLTAKNIVKKGTLAISQSSTNGFLNEQTMPHSMAYWDMGTNEGIGGNVYSKYGILWALCMVPFYVLGSFIAKFIPFQPDLISLFMVSMLGPLLASLALTIFYQLTQLLGIHRKPSLYATLFLALGSINVYYARSPYVETLDSIIFLSIIFFFQKLRVSRNSNYLLGIGILVGISFFTKIYNIILVVPVVFGFIYLYLIELKKGWKDSLNVIPKLILPISIFLSFIFYTNLMRYGAVFYTGYEEEVSSSSFMQGFFGFFFSPGKSLFIFNLGVILTVLGLKKFYRRYMTICLLIIIIVFSYIVFFSHFSNWMAGPWGTRYMLPAIFILHIPAATAMEGIFIKRRFNLKKIAIGILLFTSLLINLPNLFIDQSRWNLLGKRTKLFDRSDITFYLSYSPIRGSWELFLSSIRAYISETSGTVTFNQRSGHAKNKSDGPLKCSLSGYDESNTWFATILRSKLTRYDGSVTQLKIPIKMKIATLAVSIGLLLISLIFAYYSFRRIYYGYRKEDF